ncbi:MAG: ATP-dependent endonuclease [Bacteroidota bacterium]|nr:MAG: ATP-dependent endonuclease [Bacteroidota bacterium]
MTDVNKYFDIELRPQQQRAFNAICQFVDSSSSKIFILKGYAGTGKTTLMSGLIKRLEEDKIPFALLASTGRAAKILSDKTKTTANTIHSHIYVFNELSEDLEKLSEMQHNMAVDDKGQVTLLFNLTKINSETEKIYIIDEASMVSDEEDKNTSFAKFGTGDLLGDILSYDEKGKFIFVGDPCQLPPINQENSPALSPARIAEKYNLQPTEIELTEIIRQSKTNGIITASFNIRNLFHSNPHVKFASLPLKGYSNIYIENSHAGLLNRYIQKIRTNGYNHTTLICQTNKHCSELNMVIRSSLQVNHERLCEGDLLMVTQNNYLTGLVNGDQIVISKIGSNEYRCGLSFLQVEIQEISSQNKFSLLLIEDILYSTSTNLNTKQHKDLMIDYFKRMQGKGIKQKDSKFKDNMLKDPYLNALKCVYGYALTCHKTQGGEWDEVFLYLDNKIHGIRKPGIYQWFYTAVTRAKVNLYVVNDWFIK